MEHLKMHLYSFVFALILVGPFQAATSANELKLTNNRIQCRTKAQDVKFNRDYTGVFFDPCVVFQDQSDPNYYDESGLEVLLKKVNTKFNHIMIDFPEHTSGPMLVPKVAAKINKEMDNSTKNLLVTIRFGSASAFEDSTEANSDPAKMNFIARVLEIKSVLDEATFIYPSTIHTIIYEHDYQFQQNPASGYNLFRQIFQSYSNFTYKFGLNFNYKYCVEGKANYRVKQFFEFPLDTIYYTNTPDNIDTFPVEAVTKNIMQEFESCKLTWKKVMNGNDKPTVSFLTSWSDTDQKNTVYFNNSVHFWSAMDKWAKEGNTRLFIFNAFYTFYGGSLNTYGWWRVVPNSSYVHPLQFQFEEKPCLENPRELSPELISISSLEEPLIFGKNVGTYFQLDALREYFSRNNPCNNQCLRNLLDWLYSPFSILLVDERERIIDVAQILATNNAAGHNTTELMLFVDSSNAMKIIKSANEANSIHNGTINSLLFKMPKSLVRPLIIPEFNSELLEALKNYRDAVDQLRQIKSVLEQNRLFFKLVLTLGSEHLLLSDYFKGLDESGVLNLVDMILIENEVAPNYVKQDVRQIILHYTTLFEVLINIVQSCNKNIKVGVITGWPNTEMESLEDLISFVGFWEGINSWTKSKDVKVIMNRDLDKWTGSSWGRNGWWKFLEYENGSIPDSADQLEYKNKKEITLKLARNWLNSLKKEKLFGLFTNWRSLIFLLLAIVAAIILASVMAHFRLGRAEKIADDFVKGSGREIIIGMGMEESIAEFDWSYDMKVYEIPKKYFIIKREANLGLGQFGTVCEAILERNGIVLKAAAKMTTLGFSDTALKGVLSEIKLMTYLGKHAHIVELVGAYTSELKRRKALIFLEICELGSLEGFLREQKIEELTPNMYRWAYEISDGMEYIASKRIVHLDLATRNVLLTSQKVAKISDFGLSRRLQNYDFYAKKKQEPLPWRWMSIESLAKLEFSEKSDVWAFGVTLWEIFAIGDVPYKSEVDWSPNFLIKLEQGLRLDRPFYCREDEFDLFSIIQSCWNTDKDERPTFTRLKNELIQFVSE